MQFLGLPIFEGSYASFLDRIMEPTQKILVFTPNPEILVRASKDQGFLDILKKATHNTPDANGLYVGAMIQEGIGFFRAAFITFFHKKQVQKKYGELIKGSDMTSHLLKYAGDTQKRILILDKRVDTIQSAFDQRKSKTQQHLKELLEQKYPGIIVQVIFDGDMKSDGIAHLIELKQISYVFSCLGMKKQEKALVDIWSYLPSSQRVVGIGVGASIDFVLRLQKRAPIIFQTLGLEWLYRLILEPRKRWKRIYMALIEFPRMVKSRSE